MKMNSKGYTLVELLVVMVIVGILASQAVFMLTSSKGKVKAATFNMRSDFNLARSEAVDRCRNVLIQFVESGTADDDAFVFGSDGYRICLDDDADSNCDTADTMLKDVSFGDVQFYDTDLGGAGGPNVELDNATALVPGNGVSFTANRFEMQPSGTSNKAGTVYLYVSEPVGSAQGTATGMRAKPFAVAVARAATGRVRLARWRINDWGTR